MSREKRCRAKNWVFTINNYTPEVENRLKELECEWMVFGHEQGEEGTKHLQGALCFKGKRDAKALGKLFPWHLEVMHGSPQDSKTYCTKEDMTGYFEKGIMPENGRKKGGESNKKRWEDAYDAAKEGRFDDIPRDLYLCHDRAFHRVYEENKKDPSMDELGDKDLKDHFLWLYGNTGTGKSHLAREISKKLKCEEPYYKQINKWWNGYKCQKVTIIEEADPKRCEHLAGYFKQWADKWPFSGEVKCGNFPNMRPQYIIVTSNYRIEECFQEAQDYVPLQRRFTEHELKFRGEPFDWPSIIPSEEEEKEGTGPSALPGNSIPGELEDLPHPGSIPSSQPEMEEEVVDLPSEPDEPMKKKRKCIED